MQYNLPSTESRKLERISWQKKNFIMSSCLHFAVSAYSSDSNVFVLVKDL